MPVKIPDDLPAKQILEAEQIFVMPEARAFVQDIRPLRIAIVNLMPQKSVTETQLLRLLGNTPLQISVTLLRMASHQSKTTPEAYLARFYENFVDCEDQYFDGLIITGAPVETMDFTAVKYWPELQKLMAWSKSHVYSVMHICWGAQAGLYYHYGVGKQALPEKMFGVFDHTVREPTHHLLRGFDETFMAPHSRHTGVSRTELLSIPALSILVESEKAGVYLVATRDGRQVFVTGHPEYDAGTLHGEYLRDVKRGLGVKLPEHYYLADDPTKTPRVTWRSHAQLLFANWLSYIYEETPFVLSDLKPLL